MVTRCRVLGICPKRHSISAPSSPATSPSRHRSGCMPAQAIAIIVIYPRSQAILRRPGAVHLVESEVTCYTATPHLTTAI